MGNHSHVVHILQNVFTDHMGSTSSHPLDDRKRPLQASLTPNKHDCITPSASAHRDHHEYGFNADGDDEDDEGEDEDENQNQLMEMKLLASQALFNLRQFEECINLLGDEDSMYDQIQNQKFETRLTRSRGRRRRGAARNGTNSVGGDGDMRRRCSPELEAALCVMRARVFERQDNVTKAVLWYKRALRADFCCFVAFDSLVNKSLVCPDEARLFIQDITSGYINKGSNESKPSTNSQSLTASSWLAQFYRASTHITMPIPSCPPSLQSTVDVTFLRAKRLFQRLDFAAVARVLRMLMTNEPFLPDDCIQLYLVSLVELEDRQGLFSMAHELIARDPKSATSWLAVAYYYLSSGKYDVSRRFLRKATSLESRFLPAWVALGHAFAMQDESDQAMASYRTAARLFPGALQPPLFMGMEYARQGGLAQAEHYLQNAVTACMNDPAPLHELGVVAYRLGDLPRAAQCFRKALMLWNQLDGAVQGRRAEAEEVCLVNLGHCCRRMGQYDAAKECYQKALILKPRVHSTCTALGITLHACGDFDGAVSMYHRALRDCPGDASANELLERALYDLSTFRKSPI